jgi:hypothetical protein
VDFILNKNNGDCTYTVQLRPTFLLFGLDSPLFSITNIDKFILPVKDHVAIQKIKKYGQHIR